MEFGLLPWPQPPLAVLGTLPCRTDEHVVMEDTDILGLIHRLLSDLLHVVEQLGTTVISTPRPAKLFSGRPSFAIALALCSRSVSHSPPRSARYSANWLRKLLALSLEHFHHRSVKLLAKRIWTTSAISSMTHGTGTWTLSSAISSKVCGTRISAACSTIRSWMRS